MRPDIESQTHREPGGGSRGNVKGSQKSDEGKDVENGLHCGNKGVEDEHQVRE